MFTGLIADVGKIVAVQRSSQDWRLRIACGFDMTGITLGDSIAVNGACLTVVAKSQSTFDVDASLETVQRTTFATLSPGAPVNLEQALTLADRLDGHLVQGHVDAVGQVDRITPKGRSVEIWFRVPASSGRYIVEKGSIAVDGVSLTVNSVRDMGEETGFAVNIIPHTQLKTTLAGLTPGSRVNVETDLIGRYVERLLKGGAVHSPAAPSKAAPGPIDEAWLRSKGFA
ncbi:MAG: riboflavin synthase [Magnetococcales bacterium]|nr:riboflavin synthase [Magnetococcales bacterium]